MGNKTPLDIVQEYFPDATEDFVEFLIWHRTAYPAGNITGSFEGDLRKACVVYKDAKERGINLCDFCDAEAQSGKNVCKVCEEALESHK
jgi:hypothetical protein